MIELQCQRARLLILSIIINEVNTSGLPIWVQKNTRELVC